MTKSLLCFCFCLFGVFNIYASISPDSNISISSLKNNYEFVYNHHAKKVEVKEVLNSSYVSKNSLTRIHINETYNNDVTIDNVEARIDNRSVRDLNPTYAYYSSDDIFFSDEKVCYFTIVLPKSGSSGEVTWKETVDDPRYFTSIYFTDAYHLEKGEVTVKVPRWMNVELKEMNFGKYNISKTTTYNKSDDEDVITYSFTNLPAMVHEENSPGPTYVYPHLLVLSKSATPPDNSFTYFGSVADQYNWYAELVKGINTNNEIISAKAKDITKGLNTDLEKIRAIFYYVKDNIRYLAFEDGLAGFKPEKADEVLRKKYGDCKGMANLTKELLVSMGFDARLCWLGTDHIAYDYSTPSLAVDNHMICGLIYKGKTIYLDATETYLGINEYAERIQNRQVLMENGEKYILGRVPIAENDQNFEKETSKLKIDGNNLIGEVKHIWKGEDKEDVLAGLNSIKKEKTDEAMTKFLSANDNDFVINELKLTDKVDQDLVASFKLNHKNAISLFSKAYYIDLDTKKEFLNSAIKLDERKHDFWFEHKINLIKEIELAIPANYKLPDIPPVLNITNPDYEFHIQYSVSPTTLVYKKSIIIKNTHLNSSKFEQWNRDVEQLAKTYNQNIVLKPL